MYVFFCDFILSTLLFYSYRSSSFPIISFSVEYNNKRAEWDGLTRAIMATRDGTGRGRGGAGRHNRYVFCYVQFFFLLSSFLLLTFIISFAANYSNRQGGAEWNSTGRDDAGGNSNAGRDGRQAGGRRR